MPTWNLFCYCDFRFLGILPQKSGQDDSFPTLLLD
uniref:Uncharacterized protein n=1 Tax=Arundo donax TaxID=35708 RepID=A0A0A9QMK7_ARUDO